MTEGLVKTIFVAFQFYRHWVLSEGEGGVGFRSEDYSNNLESPAQLPYIQTY